jgi:hypothetical protein
MEEMIKWLERKIEQCDEFDNMHREKWAFIQTLKQLRKIPKTYSKSEAEEIFGREAFYAGREIKRINDNGNVIFKRPTYNGYLRELNNEG